MLARQLEPPPGWCYFDSADIGTQDAMPIDAKPTLVEVEPEHYVACVPAA